jgi:O-acetyl-ADP-ribose deacetylase (regulator of RNase III)
MFQRSDVTLVTSGIIAHVCNDQGAFGAGVALALRQKYPHVARDYFSLRHYQLGTVQYVSAGPGLVVANMIAQHGLRSARNPVPLQYDHLRACLISLNAMASRLGYTVHMPRIGSGLAGGEWRIIGGIIQDVMTVPVIIHSL